MRSESGIICLRTRSDTKLISAEEQNMDYRHIILCLRGDVSRAPVKLLFTRETRESFKCIGRESKVRFEREIR